MRRHELSYKDEAEHQRLEHEWHMLLQQKGLIKQWFEFVQTAEAAVALYGSFVLGTQVVHLYFGYDAHRSLLISALLLVHSHVLGAPGVLLLAVRTRVCVPERVKRGGEKVAHGDSRTGSTDGCRKRR